MSPISLADSYYYIMLYDLYKMTTDDNKRCQEKGKTERSFIREFQASLMDLVTRPDFSVKRSIKGADQISTWKILRKDLATNIDELVAKVKEISTII
jgi:hypothetical protein